jgi:hypothetical protein
VVEARNVTGNEYADWIAAYLTKSYGPRGLVVYREVSLGKTIIGKNRRVDMLAIDQSTDRAIVFECKYQASFGTADEKIPYTLQDLEALHVPAFLIYAGAGFSTGVLHLLEGSPIAAYCLPGSSLEPSGATLELDHVMATRFGWWGSVLRQKTPFDVNHWLDKQRSKGESGEESVGAERADLEPFLPGLEFPPFSKLN